MQAKEKIAIIYDNHVVLKNKGKVYQFTDNSISCGNIIDPNAFAEAWLQWAKKEKMPSNFLKHPILLIHPSTWTKQDEIVATSVFDFIGYPLQLQEESFLYPKKEKEIWIAYLEKNAIIVEKSIYNITEKNMPATLEDTLLYAVQKLKTKNKMIKIMGSNSNIKNTAKLLEKNLKIPVYIIQDYPNCILEWITRK